MQLPLELLLTIQGVVKFVKVFYYTAVTAFILVCQYQVYQSSSKYHQFRYCLTQHLQ